MKNDRLDPLRLRQTLEELCLRIEERFPDSGLAGVARQLFEIAGESDRTLAWIERPSYGLRAAIGGVIALLLALLIAGIAAIEVETSRVSGLELLQALEAVLNELILIGAAILFLTSVETRVKRRRVVRAINELRSIAHVIDAHQLTKDPGTLGHEDESTTHSPKRTLTAYQLSRYLDYCSELLALTGKVGFLYVQSFDDPEANAAAGDLEQLTTGLARKVWQKVMLLHSAPGAGSGAPSVRG
ncbi:MAG: hypothetical protein ACYTFV_10030 [Planctomycetota bacterium]